jgi:DNA-binding HxlR family transcriptional regulator
MKPMKSPWSVGVEALFQSYSRGKIDPYEIAIFNEIENGPVSFGDLRIKLDYSPALLTTLLRRGERDGLVEVSIEDSYVGKTQWNALTDRGVDYLNKARKIVEAQETLAKTRNA